jgi:hypothetical protein
MHRASALHRRTECDGYPGLRLVKTDFRRGPRRDTRSRANPNLHTLDNDATRGEDDPMLRRMALAVVSAIALYLLVYVGLSASGSYHRFVESLIGPTIKDEWLPRGFTHPAVANLFWPAYALDCQLWHPIRPETDWHYTKDKSGWQMTRPDSKPR